MLQVAVMNESTAISDADVQKMLPAFEQQVNKDLSQFWNVLEAKFSFVPAGSPPPGSWWVVFLDDSDQADALAYHDLTADGLPLSKVFVKTLEADKASISVGATHEIVEMFVDPWLNGAYQDANGTFWASEVADPVEDDEYGYEIDGILVTDFVTPSWFAHAHASTAYDFKGHAMKTFEILSGGYAQKFDGKDWKQVTGTRAKSSLRAHAQPGTRRDRRSRRTDGWTRSTPNFTQHRKALKRESPGRVAAPA